MVIRGAVYRVDLGRPRGHEQGGRRHGVVLAPADGAAWPVVIVVPTSTSAQPAPVYYLLHGVTSKVSSQM